MKEIEKHLKKLEEYIKTPDKCDNKGFLKDAKDNIVLRDKIIQSRIRRLNAEISKFNGEILKIEVELAKRGVSCN